ncbi:MAG: CsgG/HfaB family protein, partial [Burkholderiaceae bacterium]
SQGANPQLETCSEPLGTVAFDEDTSSEWYGYLRQSRLGSTTPVLRMMVQQSNCFVVVERGRSLNNVMRERELTRSGELRQGSNFGQGQLAAADYTMAPSITFSDKNTGGVRASSYLGRLPGIAGTLGYAAGGIRANEASTTLLMIDNRSGVQLAAAEGSARNFDWNGVGSAFTSLSGWTSVGGYSNTPEGKIIVASFMDSYNKLVKATRNYKAQTVKDGLGTGGTLGVQGGTNPASQKLEAQPAASPAKPAAPASKPSTKK